ncbi:hypothetical protein [Streptomyces sp. 8K308]|uniref:hypothetical protein n=1 Tax=Streptomyces sp. 8K308 TaxID=2530388 RepID=UPI001FB84568|nr:hypothetical protein [Streptomyces sp. 8K308]
MTHDYIRHGTMSLFAGSVIAQHYRRHPRQEFLRFLELIDVAVPRAELTTRKLSCSTHCSVVELERDIRGWINEWDKDPKPFIWTKTANDILETLAAYCTTN